MMGKRTRRVFRLVLRALLAVAAPLSADAPTASTGPPVVPPERKSVLILNVEQPHLPWVAGVSSGLFATFEAEPSATRPDVHTDYLESVRLPDRAAAETIWFRARYRGEHFDAIVAVTNSALAFLAPLRDELFPGVPIVLLTPQRSLENASLPPGVVGLGARFEIEKTLDLAKAVLPDTRQVAYVAEDGDGNARWRKDLSALGLDFIDLTGLRLEDLEKRVASLPPHTVVFFESFHSDGSGRRFVPRDVLSRVAPLSNSPIFGVSATMIGYGLVGGWVLDFPEVGAETARMVLKILAGQPVPRVPDPSTFSRLVFDGRQLRRWGITDSQVPAGAQVLHRNPSLWNDHRGAVLLGAGAMLLQGGLIAALLFERRRRAVAESEGRRHQAEITHLNRVAAMGELASSLAHELNQPLTAILTNAQAARRLLGKPSPDLEEIGASLADIVEDDQRAGDVIHRMRSLLRKEESRRTPVDLNDAVRRVVRLVSSDAQLRKTSIATDLDASLPAVSGDGVQLQQVILNLVVNGLDAVAERPPDQRRIEVRTASVSGGRIAVTVTDSGRGIPPGDVARVFEPFFTTKAHGLGIGLAICRSIVDAHAGRLAVRAAPGGGCAFECEFPALEGGSA